MRDDYIEELTDEEYRAKIEGMEGCYSGISRGANPYFDDPEKFNAWDMGWAETEFDINNSYGVKTL